MNTFKKSILVMFLTLFAFHVKGVALYYPVEYHILSSYETDGNRLEFEDGSEWTVHTNKNTLFNWSIQDPLIITPNASYFSKAKFTIVNKNKGGYVEVALLNSPFDNHPSTKHVHHIDLYHHTLILEQGMAHNKMLTYWNFDSDAVPLVEKWKVGDAVILGSENIPWYRCYEAPKTVILINCQRDNMNDRKYVYAQQK